MVVTDEGINSLGFPAKIEASLKEKGIDCVVWANAGGECPTPNLLEGAKVAREFGADCTIGIGGGSCMDAAKVISVLANNDPDYVLPNFYKFLVLPGRLCKPPAENHLHPHHCWYRL